MHPCVSRVTPRVLPQCRVQTPGQVSQRDTEGWQHSGVAPCLRQLMAAHGLMDCTACLAVVRSGALAVEYRRLAAIECGVVIRVINSDEAHHRRRSGRYLMRSASAAGAPLDREWARSVVVVVVLVVLMLRYRAHALVDLGGVEQIVLRQ
jgi:hypothetical protein